MYRLRQFPEKQTPTKCVSNDAHDLVMAFLKGALGFLGTVAIKNAMTPRRKRSGR